MDPASVLDTNEYCNSVKKSAVAMGYYQDDYLTLFVKKAHKKCAIANNCFYARFQSVYPMVWKFLNRVENSKAQIVNLGAGYDTLFWRLKDQHVELAKFVEVDFSPVTSKKCYIIGKNKQLLEKLSEQDEEVKNGETDLHSKVYHLVAADLRNISELESKLAQCGVSFSAPTLLIAEVVLGFNKKEHTDQILRWIATKFTSAVFMNYELCNVEDTVGVLFVGGFHGVGCDMPSIDYCKTVESHRSKFLNNNWDGAEAWLSSEIYDALPSAEKQRISNLELVDESIANEMRRHWCLSIGWKGKEYEVLAIREPLIN